MKESDSDWKEYLTYCQEMRSFLYKRVCLHLRYVMMFYVVGLVIVLASLWLILRDSVVSWSEAAVLAVLVANFYLLVRFHMTRYSTSVIERTRWHANYESVLRIRLLASFLEQRPKAAKELIPHCVAGLFPDFDEARRISLASKGDEGWFAGVQERIAAKFDASGA